jgi:hypothetical protein
MRTIILLLCLSGLYSSPAAAQLRSSTGSLWSYEVPPERAGATRDSSALQLSGLSSSPSAGKLLKHTGIGTLAGVALGAAFAAINEASDDHTNHEEDGLVFAASMLIGAVTGAVIGLVSAFVN